MIRSTSIFAFCLAAAASADDLLRLSDGELSGRFAGINEEGLVIWDRPESAQALEFKSDKLRHIVLDQPAIMEPGMDASHITLVNGDRLPARVLGVDATQVEVESPMAGTLSIPRDAVASISPSPFGGRLIYTGPFSDEAWKQLPEPDEEEDAHEPSWQRVGSRWYYKGGKQALALDSSMPESSVVRFKMEWQSRQPLAIIMHADFSQPEIPTDLEDPDDIQEWKAHQDNQSHRLSGMFGHAYVMNLRSGYANLQRIGYDEEGKHFQHNLRSSSSNFRFGEQNEAEIEIRSHLAKGIIALHIDGKFATQWTRETVDPEEDNPRKRRPTGGGLGFHLTNNNRIRISEVSIAEWNGLPDSARSLESETQDIVLLNNGMDRFSGRVSRIEENMLFLKGRYAELEIPYADVAEIHLARDDQRSHENHPMDQLRVHYQPIGRFSGTAGTAPHENIELKSPLLGRLTLNLQSARILEYDNSSNFLNNWDDDLQ